MIGFLLSPIARYIGGAFAILAIIGGIYWKGRSDGSASITLRMERERSKAVSEALRIERDTLPCVSDPKCVLADPFRMPDIRPDPGK